MFGKLQTLEHLLKPDLKSCFPPPPQSASGITFSLISSIPITTPSSLWFHSLSRNQVLFPEPTTGGTKRRNRNTTEGFAPPALRKGGRGEAGSLQKAMCEWIGAEDEGFGGRWEKLSRFLRAPEGSSGARAARAAERRGARAPQAGFGKEKRGVRAAGGRLGWKGSSGRTGEAECPQDTDK